MNMPAHTEVEPQAELADVVIVGGGPAGLSAARELRRLGAGTVVILERDGEAGGIPRHCGHYPFGMREFTRVLRGSDYACRLVGVARKAGVDIRTRSVVTAIGRQGRVEYTTPEGRRALQGRAVLLATGLRETSRAARLIGGEKPGGILPTGALQGIVYLNGEKPFSRPVILGSELVAFSALMTCRHAGIRPVAMVEPGSRPSAFSLSRMLPFVMGVPYLSGTKVDAVLGRERVEEVVISQSGETSSIVADGIIVSGGFRPEATVAVASGLAIDPGSRGPQIDQFGRIADSVCFATGNVLRGVETSGWCWSEGRRTAHAILAAIRGQLPEDDGRIVEIGDGPVKLAVPARLSSSSSASPAHRHLQLRLDRPARGVVQLMQAGKVIAKRSVNSLPDRRILLHLPEKLSAADGAFELVFREA
jgi:thioredoxin reductase